MREILIHRPENAFSREQLARCIELYEIGDSSGRGIFVGDETCIPAPAGSDNRLRTEVKELHDIPVVGVRYQITDGGVERPIVGNSRVVFKHQRIVRLFVDDPAPYPAMPRIDCYFWIRERSLHQDQVAQRRIHRGKLRAAFADTLDKIERQAQACHQAGGAAASRAVDRIDSQHKCTDDRVYGELDGQGRTANSSSKLP